MPVTTPLNEPIVPAAKLLLLHNPPLTASLNDVVNPAHTVEEPIIAVGAVLTVTVMDVAQPVGKVYVIAAVPTAIPLTTPVEEPTLTAPAPALHTPLPGSVNVIVDPAQTADGPLIDDGNGLTVIVFVT